MAWIGIALLLIGVLKWLCGCATKPAVYQPLSLREPVVPNYVTNSLRGTGIFFTNASSLWERVDLTIENAIPGQWYAICWSHEELPSHFTQVTTTTATNSIHVFRTAALVGSPNWYRVGNNFAPLLGGPNVVGQTNCCYTNNTPPNP